MHILFAQEIPLLRTYTKDSIKGVQNNDVYQNLVYFIPGKGWKFKGIRKSNGKTSISSRTLCIIKNDNAKTTPPK